MLNCLVVCLFFSLPVVVIVANNCHYSYLSMSQLIVWLFIFVIVITVVVVALKRNECC